MSTIFIWSASWAEHSQVWFQSTIVYEFLIQNGYKLVKNAKDADYILLNAYPFDNYEEKLVLLSLYYYLNTYKDKKIIVFWSAPNMIYGIKRIPWLIYISYSEYEKFDTIFHGTISIKDIHVWRIRFFIPLKLEEVSLWDLLHNALWSNLKLETNYEISEYDLSITIDSIIDGTYQNNTIEEYPWDYNYMEDSIDNFYIETTRGCGFDCSYCAIKRVSWYTKSFPIDDIISDIQHAVSIGAKNIIIIDEDVGSYGIDIWLDFAFLINKINEIPWDFHIKFYYLEPKHLVENFHRIAPEFWENKVSYARITLQTTSQRILTLMNRNYDITEVLNICKKIKMYNTSILLWSIVIYGFPTETYDEFSDYFRLLKYFDCTDFLCYADKKWTKTYNMQKNSHEEILRKSLVILKMKQKFGDKIDPVIWSPRERKKILASCY